MTDYFKDIAKKYDSMQGVEISNAVSNAILEFGDLDASKTTALELGCGTGLMSVKIAPHVHSLFAVDVSSSMLELLNEKIRVGDIPGNVTTKEVNLLDEAAQAEYAGKFDVVVSALAYHHIPDFKGITEALFKVLKPGGKVFIADLRQGGRSIHGDMSDADCEAHGVSSRGGFSAEFMKGLFTDAGFANFESREFSAESWGASMHTKDHSGKTGQEKQVDGETHYHTFTDLLLSVGQKPLN